MELDIQDALTVGGAAILVLILTGVVKAALPNFDSKRFGAALAVALGLVIVLGANATALAEIRLDIGTAVLTGILAGASAAGIYDAGKGLGSGATEPVNDELTGGGG